MLESQAQVLVLVAENSPVLDVIHGVLLQQESNLVSRIAEVLTLLIHGPIYNPIQLLRA